MSDVKISQLPFAACVTPTALVPLVQCGITFSTYACNIGGGGGGVIISGIGTSCCSSYRCGVGNTLCDANNSANLGGRSHFISGGYSTLVGGECNTVGAGFGGYFPYNFIGGGCCNCATGRCDSRGDYGAGTNTVVGGVENIADGAFGFIGGGCRNTSGYAASSVVGGYFNTVSNAYSFIGGGVSNIASNQFDSVTGGQQNNASGGYSFIGAGILNNVSGCGAVVVAGQNNISSSCSSFVGAGCCNTASGYSSSVVGGYFNSSCDFAFVGGGSNNKACGSQSFIGAGQYHSAGYDNDVVIRGAIMEQGQIPLWEGLKILPMVLLVLSVAGVEILRDMLHPLLLEDILILYQTLIPLLAGGCQI
jgi:hypothetical protein